MDVTPPPGPAAPPALDRPYLLERVDEAAVVQLYADGFSPLPLDQKILLWHLYNAAIAGRDIFYDQRYGHNLDMRDVLEAVLRHPGDDTETFAEVRRYTKLFWVNTGPYNNLTARKFVLNVAPEKFAAMVHAAARQGARLPRRRGESVDQLLARLAPMFFDRPRLTPRIVVAWRRWRVSCCIVGSISTRVRDVVPTA